MGDITPQENHNVRPSQPTMHESEKKAFRSILIMAVVFSLVLGAISGAVFGVLAVNNQLGSGIEKLFGLNASGSAITENRTVQVAEDSATVDVVNQVQDSVVSVIGTQDFSQISQDSNFFSPFGIGVPSQPQQGKRDVRGGTGFIVSSDGLILTNKHVVDLETIDYSVVLNDGTRVDAQVLARDPSLDLAILKIDKTGLPAVKLGDSESVQIGETVIAIGNALGRFQNTVTKGIVSGLSRTIEAGDGSGQTEVIEDTIQTDAAINSGNSGGPLLNISGEVIGVNTAVSTEGQSLGFAIPINAAKQDVQSVQEKGKIVRPYLGIRYTVVTANMQEQNNLSVDYGALLVRGSDASELAVIPGSPADKAGLEENDIILEFDGKKITSDTTLTNILIDYKVGDTVSLKVLHDGEEKTIQLTLGEREV
ncbi:MAG: trypsin-like peptidase domain-containing protein [Candidatus Nomurabacteria bacterium]|nr:MAG: trypsin-like peptidase domain-containing protein [Candidatus Nomurabacteria bacterium]